jgi:hypothetical protein
MLKLFKRWAPVAIVIVTIINLIVSFEVDNTAAVNANIVALVGWLAIVFDEFFDKKGDTDVSNS